MKRTVREELRRACNGVIRIAPARFVRMFKPRFAKLVESGEKRQTIRPIPKRIPRRGDTLNLREWSGKPYRSKQRDLRSVVILEIKWCLIEESGITMPPREGSLPWKAGVEFMRLVAKSQALDRFAQDDGFRDWPEMRDWFKAEHGLPFEGIIIYW